MNDRKTMRQSTAGMAETRQKQKTIPYAEYSKLCLQYTPFSESRLRPSNCLNSHRMNNKEKISLAG